MPKLKYFEHVFIAYGIDEQNNRYYSMSSIRNVAIKRLQEDYPFVTLTEVKKYKKDDNQLA